MGGTPAQKKKEDPSDEVIKLAQTVKENCNYSDRQYKELLTNLNKYGTNAERKKYLNGLLAATQEKARAESKGQTSKQEEGMPAEPRDRIRESLDETKRAAWANYWLSAEYGGATHNLFVQEVDPKNNEIYFIEKVDGANNIVKGTLSGKELKLSYKAGAVSERPDYVVSLQKIGKPPAELETAAANKGVWSKAEQKGEEAAPDEKPTGKKKGEEPEAKKEPKKPVPAPVLEKIDADTLAAKQERWSDIKGEGYKQLFDFEDFELKAKKAGGYKGFEVLSSNSMNVDLIVAVQLALGVKVTGRFDKATVAAVKKAQEDAAEALGIKKGDAIPGTDLKYEAGADGKFGIETFTLLKKAAEKGKEKKKPETAAPAEEIPLVSTDEAKKKDEEDAKAKAKEEKTAMIGGAVDRFLDGYKTLKGAQRVKKGVTKESILGEIDGEADYASDPDKLKDWLKGKYLENAEVLIPDKLKDILKGMETTKGSLWGFGNLWGGVNVKKSLPVLQQKIDSVNNGHASDDILKYVATDKKTYKITRIDGEKIYGVEM